ncbi:MAG: hypothetical protein K2K75_12555 [Muribaculaceae bacterium]|nr:hypothetical protein [Muribaculaceae bacterium]
MSKEKIFKPEDFDKTIDKSFWRKHKGKILCSAAILIVAAIVVCYIFCWKEEQEKKINKEHYEQVSKNPDTTYDKTITNKVEPGTTEEPQDVVNVDSLTIPEPTQLTVISANVEQEAMNVIRGDYGNVPERRQKLGSKYREIQDRVNELKRQGAF